MIEVLVFKINNKWRKSTYTLEHVPLNKDKDAWYWLKTMGYIKIHEAEYYDADRR